MCSEKKLKGKEHGLPSVLEVPFAQNLRQREQNTVWESTEVVSLEH